MRKVELTLTIAGTASQESMVVKIEETVGAARLALTLDVPRVPEIVNRDEMLRLAINALDIYARVA